MTEDRKKYIIKKWSVLLRPLSDNGRSDLRESQEEHTKTKKICSQTKI